MFFVLACLRPALASAEPPTRVRLMHAVAGRFFRVVAVATTLVLLTGLAMIAMAASVPRRAGLAFNMPIDWYVMAVLGVVMIAVFGHIRFALYPRLGRAVAAEDWPAGGAVLASVRLGLVINVVLAVVIVVATRLGATT